MNKASTKNEITDIRVDVTSMQRARIGGQAIVLARREEAKRSRKIDDQIQNVQLVSKEKYLPLTLGRVASAELITGLRKMAESRMNDEIAQSEFNPHSAQQWLSEIEGPTYATFEEMGIISLKDRRPEASLPNPVGQDTA